jgi:hypothetical protein
MYNFHPVKSFAFILGLLLLAGCGGNSSTPQQTQTPNAAPALPQKAPDEDAAMAAIAAVNDGQKTYLARYRRYALTYEELMQALFLKEEPTPETTGYEIKLRPTADAARYTIIAAPATPSPTARHFFSDQTGEIRAEQGKDANAQSPTVTPSH